MRTKIIKCYVDIGCIYEGDKTLEYAFEDYQCWNLKYGLIGILKLEIDIIEKTKTEISFEQVSGPSVNICTEYLISSFVDNRHGQYENIDMIIGWNSRDFDLPIIINNLECSEKYKEFFAERVATRDRDLLDLCVIRDISVKGGLEEVIKRLKIKHNLRCKDCPVYSKEEICFLKDFDIDTNRYNNSLKAIKQRNEFDIRVLPLLEERLGYLYEPRLPMDRYHKKWV